MITKVGSFLKHKPQIRYKIKMPTKPIGKVSWMVTMEGCKPITYATRKDAKALVDLVAVAGLKADIIRHEVTEDGFYLD